MSPTLEDQERHLLVKVIDRILYKLDDLVRPYVHKILVVIEPLLIDEDYYARVEGREIISNLAKVWLKCSKRFFISVLQQLF
jgi:splicing factor 3B subunit 1